MTLDDERSATLILRVWLEGGTHNFRGRLTAVDTSAGHEGGDLTVGVASSPGEVVGAVHAWLDEFLGQASPPVDGGN
jgi:predicted nucleotidyltransferase